MTVPISRRKSLALLAYLAVPGRSQARDGLLPLFWPEYETKAARANLRRDLGRLRKAVGAELIPGDNKQIHFQPDAGLQVDVLAFPRPSGRGRRPFTR